MVKRSVLRAMYAKIALLAAVSVVSIGIVFTEIPFVVCCTIVLLCVLVDPIARTAMVLFDVIPQGKSSFI